MSASFRYDGGRRESTVRSVRLRSLVCRLLRAGRLGRTVTTVLLTIIYFYPLQRVCPRRARSCRASCHSDSTGTHRNGPQQLCQHDSQTTLYDNDKTETFVLPDYCFTRRPLRDTRRTVPSFRDGCCTTEDGVRTKRQWCPVGTRALPRGYSPSPKRAARPLPHVVGGKPFIMLCV